MYRNQNLLQSQSRSEALKRHGGANFSVDPVRYPCQSILAFFTTVCAREEITFLVNLTTDFAKLFPR